MRIKISNSQIINFLFSLFFLYALTSLLFFLYVNKGYILNPESIPNYNETVGYFAYGKDDLAKFRELGFDTPMSIFPYVIAFQSVLLMIFIKFKKVSISYLTIIVGILLFLGYLFLKDDNIIIRSIGENFVVLSLPFILIATPILFISTNPNNKYFLIQIFFTVILFLIYFYWDFVLFFD